MNLERKLFNSIKKVTAILTLGAVLAGCQPSVSSKSGDSNDDEPEITHPPTTNPTEDEYDYTTTTREIVSKTIEAIIGGSIEVTDVTSYLFGTKLTIPNGALSSNTEISVGEVDNPPELPDGLNYIGSAINFEPDGINFNNPITIQIPYQDNFRSDAGISDDSNLKLYSYDKSSQNWEEINITSLDTTNNIITAEINHFSYYAITGLSSMPPSDLGIPLPGDLLYTQGVIGGDARFNYSWMPGHVGIYVGEKNYSIGLASGEVKSFGKYNVVEALLDGVQFSYYNIPNVTETFESSLKSFSGNNMFMGAREPKNFALTSQQRETIVNYLESQIGKPYAKKQTALAFYGMLRGSLVKGPDSFNCVGLAEKAYELAGINDGEGLTTYNQEEEGITSSTGICLAALTPAEHYNSTRPASGKSSGDSQSPALVLEKIVFSSNRDGNWDIYSMNSDSSNIQRLTTNSSDEKFPRLSFDKNKIVFISNETGYDNIYLMDADGASPRNLMNIKSNLKHPSWSINDELAFVNNSIICFMEDINQSNSMARIGGSESNEYPSFAPSGRGIVFVRTISSNWEIYKAQDILNNPSPIRVTYGEAGATNFSPKYSHDGNKIAFCSLRKDGSYYNYDIYVMDADGSNGRRLTTDSSADSSPLWSIDGSRIFFESERDGNKEIYVMNADGTNQINLTNNPAEDSFK
ncbi:hypothetical protein M0R72_16870 [Candidatus Pacearchaeota archaeon]|jgi:Tol biopolymer transport system component|nr:hypothetical protein [Candidatus Pacearchaeota archaeon]